MIFTPWGMTFYRPVASTKCISGVFGCPEEDDISGMHALRGMHFRNEFSKMRGGFAALPTRHLVIDD
jgi:hypothetical protein